MAQHIELCKATDIPELFERFAEWYKFNPRLQERDFFDWQFKAGPYRLSDGEYDFVVLRGDTGGIIGCFGFVGFAFHCAGTDGIGGWSNLWKVEGGDGGLALLARFQEAVDNRFYLRLNDLSSRILGLLKVPAMPTMPRWWAAIDADAFIDVFAVSNSDDRRVIRASAEHWQANQAAPAGSMIKRLAPGEAFGFDHLPSIQSYVKRDAAYLNWRYVDIPRHKYHIIRTERGFGVYRIEQIMHHAVGVIRLIEWTFTAEESAGILARIAEEAAPVRPIMVDFHCTHRPISEGLRRFGFCGDGETTCTVPDLFRPIYHSGGYAVAIDMPPHRTQRSLDFNSWYITIGDSDIDRVKL